MRGLARNGTYFGVLPDGRELPFDDGRRKTAEQRLDDPDLEDIFAQRYPTGPIVAVTTPDFEPGRVRVDALFRQSGEWASRAIANVAGMGAFSSDRTIREYAQQIWGMTPAP